METNLSSRAFFWDPKAKAMRDLGTPAEWTHSAGEAINNKGQVAGELRITGLTHIFIWDPIHGHAGSHQPGRAMWPGWPSTPASMIKGYLCGASEISPGGP